MAKLYEFELYTYTRCAKKLFITATVLRILVWPSPL